MPNTHYVFTVGKDKLLKYWDADRFEQLLSLDGHHGEVRAASAGFEAALPQSSPLGSGVSIFEQMPGLPWCQVMFPNLPALPLNSVSSQASSCQRSHCDRAGVVPCRQQRRRFRHHRQPRQVAAAMAAHRGAIFC